MPSVQRFFSGCNSAAAAAVFTADSVLPSAAVERISARRAGGGRLLLEGEYAGHEEALFELEIAEGGASLRASAPAFTGVGNGTLEVLDVDSATALQQTITFTCADLGVATESAHIDIGSAVLRARTPGEAGNQISISVTERLTAAKTKWALPETWAASTATQTGEQWNFGALPLSTKGEVPEDAPRLRFGIDPTVYRQWRDYKDGAWQFGFSPALERDLPEGALVYAITGGYEVTITDGSTTETFGGDGQPPIITLYDLLAALADSALLEAAGVVAADRATGGMAAIDLPLRTRAWLRAQEGEDLKDVDIPAGAPTQALTIRCTNADMGGAERWAVEGRVSGVMGEAITGEPFTCPAASFIVPRKKALEEVKGVSGFIFTPASRSEGEGLPSVCMKIKLGARACAKSVTFRYTERPPAECDCTTMPHYIIPSRYLGYEDDMDIDNPDLKQRLDAIYEWRRAFCQDNTAIEDETTLPGNYEEGAALGWAFEVTVYKQSEMGGATFTDGVRITSAGEYPSERAAQLAAAKARGATVPAGTTTETPFAVNDVQVRALRVFPEGETSTRIPLSTWGNFTFSQRATTSVSDEILPLRYIARQHDMDFMESGVAIAMQCLMQVYDHAEALAQWDALWEAIKDDLSHITPTSADLVSGAAADARFTDRWTARADCVLLTAGILPKFDANSDAGGCWRDDGGAYWWQDTSGHYMPAFTNAAYISCRRDPETGKVTSTQEFGFSLVVACEDRLKEGDTITINIDSADGEKPYAVGDEITLHTVAGAPVFAAGGVDGNDEQTWSVTGSVSGALPECIVPTTGDTSAAWEAAGVRARLALGGIPHQLGDQFSFAVEAGQWRWRTKSSLAPATAGGEGQGEGAWGSWSALQDIPPEGIAPLADGLAVRFAAGAAPSFVPGDSTTYRALQPNAPSNLASAAATGNGWRWTGDAASATCDLGDAQRVEAVAIADYWLPDGAAMYLEYSEDGQAWSSAQLDISRPVAVLWLGERARYLRLRVENAEGGRIGWLWAGTPLALDHHASQCQRRRQWRVARSDALNAAGLLRGKGDGWQLAWQPGDAASSRLLQDDIERLLPLLEHAASTGEPFIFLPHHKHPEEAALVRFEQDAFEVTDLHQWQTDDAGERLLSANLTLEPAYA